MEGHRTGKRENVGLKGQRSTLNVEWPNTIIVNESWFKNEGLIVKARVQNEDIAMLVDTGANVTFLSENFVNRLKTSCKPDIRPINTSLVTATGESTPFHWQTNVNLSIGSKCYDHNVLVAMIVFWD